MSYHPIKSPGLESLLLHDLGRPAPVVPVLFLSDSPHRLQIKIQPQKFMPASDVHSDKPLIPALFQIAARAEELQSLESLPAVRNALDLDRASRAVIMLDAERLDAVLKAVAARKKKSAQRRASHGHFDKRISAGDRPIA
jgi:hypothetical protein